MPVSESWPASEHWHKCRYVASKLLLGGLGSLGGFTRGGTHMAGAAALALLGLHEWKEAA